MHQSPKMHLSYHSISVTKTTIAFPTHISRQVLLPSHTAVLMTSIPVFSVEQRIIEAEDELRTLRMEATRHPVKYGQSLASHPTNTQLTISDSSPLFMKDNDDDGN